MAKSRSGDAPAGRPPAKIVSAAIEFHSVMGSAIAGVAQIRQLQTMRPVSTRSLLMCVTPPFLPGFALDAGERTRGTEPRSVGASEPGFDVSNRTAAYEP